MTTVQQYFYNATLVLAVPQVYFGLNGLFRPDAHLQALEFPAHTDPTAHKLDHALMRIWAFRNLTSSFLLTCIWSVGSPRLMGTALLAGLAICVSDGFVSRALTGRGEGKHWAFAPVLVATIAGLWNISL